MTGSRRSKTGSCVFFGGAIDFTPTGTGSHPMGRSVGERVIFLRPFPAFPVAMSMAWRTKKFPVVSVGSLGGC